MKKKVFWIVGNYFDSKLYWNKIVSSLKDPNIITLECGGHDDEGCATAADVIRLLKSADIFDTRPRIIKLKGLPDDYAILADHLNLVNDTNYLVVDSEVGVYKNRRFNSAANSNFYKRICADGHLLESPLECKDISIAKKWVQQIVENSGKKIEDAALDFLIEIKGRNCDSLYSELIKLLDYSSKTINLEDVKECCVPVYLRIVWDFIDNLDMQKYDECSDHLQDFYVHAGTETGTTFRGDVEMLIGALYQHFLFVLLLKDGYDKSGTFSYNMAESAVVGFKKQTTADDGSKEWRRDLFEKGFLFMNMKKPGIQRVMNWNKSKIYGVLRDLLRCKYICRSDSMSETMVCRSLDAFCMSVCDKINEEQLLVLMGYDANFIDRKVRAKRMVLN